MLTKVAVILLLGCALVAAEGQWAICTMDSSLHLAAGELPDFLIAHEPSIESFGVYGASQRTLLVRVKGSNPAAALARLSRHGYCSSPTLFDASVAPSSLLLATATQRESIQPGDAFEDVISAPVAMSVHSPAVAVLFASREVVVFVTPSSEVKSLETKGYEVVSALSPLSAEPRVMRAVRSVEWQLARLQRPSQLSPVDFVALTREIVSKRMVKASGKSLLPDPIEDMVNMVSEDKLRSFLDGLTAVYTRLSDGGNQPEQATYFILGYLKGLGLDPFLFKYRSGFTSVVCADLEGDLQPETLVVVGAHYDDRQKDINDATKRAPGANDDGSGSAMLSELARIFATTRPSLEYTLRFCWWSGEEQGLLGSTAYANMLVNNGTEVVAMIQGDMLAYKDPAADTRLDMATVETDWDLTQFLNEVTALYVPQIAVGNTTSCCTDSAAFYSAGYPAAAYNEGGGYTIDPEYHSTLDIVDRPGYSLQQLSEITQAMLAGAGVLANIL